MVVVLSLLAALAFAFGAVLQQQAASGQPAERHMRPSLVLHLLRRPMWLAGIAMNGVGTLLQLAALWHGSLVTVQPLLVCGLLFALPLNAILLHRRRPGVREGLSAGAVCIGLTAFLLATGPTPGRGTASPLGWAVALACLAAAGLVLVAAAARTSGPMRPGLLATAAGMVNGLSAAFIKGIAHQVAASLHAGLGAAVSGLASNWELYAFAGTLLVATLLVQSAYQSGPIRWSLPALTAANPVASVILGAAVLSERVNGGHLALLGAVVGLTLVVAGILALSSSTLLGAGEPAGAPVIAPLASEQPSGPVPIPLEHAPAPEE